MRSNHTDSPIIVTPTRAQDRGGVPVVKITQEGSSVKFAVKASVPIEGVFDKWEATLTFSSTDAEAGVLEVKIHADSANTGSGMKDGKLKSKNFFNVAQDPYITFKSTKFVQTGPDTMEMQGIFTIRGVSRDNGVRPQGIRDEQWHSVYQDR